MRVTYHAPTAALHPLVGTYYEAEAPEGGTHRMRAEGAQLRCLIRGGGTVRVLDAVVSLQAPQLYLFGPTTQAYEMAIEPGTLVFGASLTPLGWHAAVVEHASALSDRIVPYADLFARGATEATEVLCAARGSAARVAAADAHCLRTTRDAALPDRAAAFVAAADGWLAGEVRGGVDGLTAACGLSRRQTERLSRDWFGASPKLLHRKYRALRTSDRLACSGQAPWSQVADPTYTDQSHLIREFKQFIGYTPGEFARRPDLLIKTAVAARGEVSPGDGIRFLA